VKVCSLDTQGAVKVSGCIHDFSPRVIHAFHAYHAGRVARLTAHGLGIPYIVTLTGSDVYEALHDFRKEETHAVLREASAVVAFAKSVKRRILELFPGMAEKTFIIPQGVASPCGHFHVKRQWLPEARFLFFLPAGLRPVKNVLFPLAPLAELCRKDPGIGFVLAGPVLEAGYAAEVLTELDRYPFAHYLGAVSHESIGYIYRKSGVILNTSLFEGGMANSVLEALSFGRPVLASDIEGNRSIIKEGMTGLLYRDGVEFQEKAHRLVTDVRLRERLGEQGRQFVMEHCRPEAEADAYLALYEKVVSGNIRIHEPLRSCERVF